MKYPKLREILEAVKALLSKPYTSTFPYQPHIPFSSFRGRPYFDQDSCVGCTACVNVCPTGALSFRDIETESGHKRILRVNWDICIECGQCQLHCLTTNGIKLSNEFDLAVTENRNQLYQIIEKELVTCENCSANIGPYDHINWTIKKLCQLYVSNTSLIAFSQKKIQLRNDILKTDQEIFRWTRFKILCPRCRRQAVFTS
jgi:formate hydrogenlyase subunit 6/NADH:ubiquinone oxidoreductase subunit I